MDFGPRAFRAGGYLGEWLGGFMSEYLSRTGSVIVILALMVAAVILATQFSFGRLFSALFTALGGIGSQGAEAFQQWREERRKARQRREVMVKYGKKEAAVVATSEKKTVQHREAGTGARSRQGRGAARRGSAPRQRRSRLQPVVQKKISKTPVTAPLPLPEPERVERRLGSYTLPPVSLLDAREGRAARSTSAS